MFGYADGGNPLDRWMELLSSAHWTLERKSADPLDDMISRTHGWNERKQRFSRRQIKLAADLLVEKRWAGNPVQADT